MTERASVNRGGGIHGGITAEQTIEHFCHRFGNSASRITYFVVDPKQEFVEDQKKLLQSLATGEIAILDLACGAGAASLGLLTTLSEIRRRRQLPTLPLNVHITAADISTHALDLYTNLLMHANEGLAEIGLLVTINTTQWDMSSVEATNDLCDQWFQSCQGRGVDELVVIMANISGDKEIWASGSRSISHVAERVSNKRSSIIWIEPGSDRARNLLKKAMAAVFDILKRFQKGGASHDKVFSYEWKNELTNSVVPSQMTVALYRRSY